MNDLPRTPDSRTSPTKIITKSHRSPPAAAAPKASQHAAPSAGAQNQGSAVNVFSRAVNPRTQYPLHFDFLMRDMYDRGFVPEEWQIIAADEIHLDEAGMEIEFTLVQKEQNILHRIRVDVQAGKLHRIAW
jgi:hypothetical protein